MVDYARTSDGVTIAFTAFGSGPPLVILPPVPFSNFLAEWQVPMYTSAYRKLGSRFRVIQFDGRGTGHSQRDVTDLSLDAMVRDLEAVLAASGVGTAALFATFNACLTAIAFAATRPERVSRLALFGGTARGWQAMSAHETQALLSLIERDWDLFADMAAHAWLGWSAGELGRLVGEGFRTATTANVARATLQMASGADVTRLLPAVSAPTLVLFRRNIRQLRLEDARSLTRSLPRGRLVLLQGTSPALFSEDADATVDLLVGFFAGLEVPALAEDDASAHLQPQTAAQLSAREREVLKLLAAGETNASIAHRLGLTVHTVERHLVNIYRKIDARGRADATAFAVRHGLD